MREFVGRKMDKVAKVFRQKLREELSYMDIDRSFYPLLLIADNEGLTQKELAAFLHCDKMQAFRTIQHLTENGYIECFQDENDKRKSVLKTTKKAKLYIPGIQAAVNKISALTYGDLNASEVEEFYRILEIMENNIMKHK